MGRSRRRGLGGRLDDGVAEDCVAEGEAEDDDARRRYRGQRRVLAVEERHPDWIQDRLDEGDEAGFAPGYVAEAVCKEDVGQRELERRHDEEQQKVS